MSVENHHDTFMQRCLQLAYQGVAAVAPNPMVGSVLVFDNRIIGEGYHMEFGKNHAEVNCINSVKVQDRALIENAVLYVNLEPCSHHGKTPPCVDLILKNKIKKVVIGCKDFSAKINGIGIQILKENKVEVIVGILEKECIELNKKFFYYEKQKLPYVILKWAESADGFIGRHNQTIKISNSISDRLVHQWRAEEQAIMVGYQTATQDNPKLDVRLGIGKNPVRIVFDRDLSLPNNLCLFNQTQSTLVFNYQEHRKDNLVEYIKISNESILLQILQILHKKNISGLLVEGGAQLIQMFIKANLWNEARVIKSDVFLFEGISSPQIKTAGKTKDIKVINDRIFFFKNNAMNP